MEYLIITLLLIIIGVFSANPLLRILGQSLGFSLAAGMSTLFLVGSGCYRELLPYSYCGELSGLLNMAVTSGLVAILVLILVLTVNYKKYRVTVSKRSSLNEQRNSAKK